tara:strand:+ start:19112 stop:19618 length:507 start_codon:yes stop_codon:yes gene_type:complete
MVRKSIYILSVLLLIIVNVGLSQSINSESNINPNNLDYLFTQNFQITSNKLINVVNTNNVFINQIGNDNEVVIKTKSLNSDIALNQKGAQNKIYLDIVAENIKETISQTGNDNYVFDYSSIGVDQHSLEVSQYGNNQNLTWYGGNSLSENLKVNMQGESKTVIVRNFN